MKTTPRELLLDLLRRHPAALVELLAQLKPLPRRRRVLLVDHRGPALVIFVEDPSSRARRGFAIDLVVEVGDAAVASERRGAAAEELGCALFGALLCPDLHLARALQNDGAHVLGPAQIPRLRNAVAAARSPTLAALAVAAHGRDDPLVCIAALLAALRRPPERAAASIAFILEVAPAAQHPTLHRILREHGAAPALDAWQRASGAYHHGLDHGREQGLAVAARAILALLEQRGFAVDAKTRARVEALRCPPRAGQVLTRALELEQLDQLFAD